MHNIWRFYDDNNNISGFTIAETQEDACSKTEKYLKDVFNVKNAHLDVWRAEEDDDYNRKHPDVLVAFY